MCWNLQNVVEWKRLDDAVVADDGGNVLWTVDACRVPELQQCLRHNKSNVTVRTVVPINDNKCLYFYNQVSRTVYNFRCTEYVLVCYSVVV